VIAENDAPTRKNSERPMLCDQLSAGRRKRRKKTRTANTPRVRN